MAFSVTPCPSVGSNESLYSLKWNHYQSCMTSGLVDLLNDPDYSMTDVTLACEGQFLQAHKIALAVCSPFFKQFFKMHRVEKAGITLIALANVKYKDLRNIIQFIYNGEINVSNDELSSFLETASFLQIQGLTESYKANQPSQTQSAKPESFNFTPAKPTSAQAGVTVTPTSATVPIATSSQSLIRPHPVSVDQTLPVKRSRMSVTPLTSMSVSISSLPQVEPQVPPPTTSIPLPSSSLADYSSMHNEDEAEEEEEMISIDMKQEPIAVYSLNDDNSQGHNDGDASIGSESMGVEDDASGLDFQEFSYPDIQFNQTLDPGRSSVSRGRPPTNPNPAGSRRPTSMYSIIGDEREHGENGEYFDEQQQTTRYSCKCGTTFSMKSTLKRHLVEIEKKEVLRCEGCGKHFYRQRNLARHKRDSKQCNVDATINSINVLLGS